MNTEFHGDGIKFRVVFKIIREIRVDPWLNGLVLQWPAYSVLEPGAGGSVSCSVHFMALALRIGETLNMTSPSRKIRTVPVD